MDLMLPAFEDGRMRMVFFFTGIAMAMHKILL